MIKDLKPYAKRIIVSLSEEEKVGGLHIPQGSREPNIEGVVEAVSDEVTGIKAGDHVLLKVYEHTFFWQKRKLFSVHSDHIIAVVTA